MLAFKLCQLTEEATEAYDKEYRRFRQFHARRNLRTDCNTNLSHMLLVSSDPYV